MDPKVKFYEKGSGHATFFTKEGVYLNLVKSQKPEIENLKAAVSDSKPSVENRQTEQIHLVPLNANKNPKIIAEGLQEGKVNYFIGNDPKKWKTNIPTYQAVVYQEIYPGIDMKFYGNNRQMEYDIIVKPGADPTKVQLAYEGVEGLKVTEDGNLEISLKEGKIIQKKPVMYQEIDGKRIEVAGEFKILNPQSEIHDSHFAYGVKVAAYDKSHSLIIDPVLSYSTYLGGSGDDIGLGVAVDTSGNAYVTGKTTSTDFPTTAGAFQTTGTYPYSAAFITKVNTTGTSLVYSTYLGASDGHNEGHGIAVDGSGNAYVTGLTNSFNFPTTAGAFQTIQGGGGDAFVTKLNAAGSALAYSTYLGGNYGPEFGNGIAVDGSGNAYVTGQTSSTTFPTTTGAFQTTHGGGFYDTFVTKLDAMGTSLVYSTYLGGNGDEEGRGIAVDASGNAYLVGIAYSTSFPTTAGAFQTTFGGGVDDVFVTKLDATGTSLAYSTYLGGSSYDEGYGIAVDASGNAYVTGYTASTNFPTTAGAFQTTSRTLKNSV